MNSQFSRVAIALGVALFLGAAFTDYLDGHIARRRSQISRLGILLDPIALLKRQSHA